MRRKVIKQGHGTLTITLPSKWVEENEIKVGDEIDISQRGNKLEIIRAGNEKPHEVLLDGAGLDLFLLKRYLNTYYKMGADIVKVSYEDPSILTKIQEILQKNLIGYEIIQQSKDQCTVKSFSSVANESYDIVLRRIFRLLIMLGDETYQAIAQKDISHLKAAALLEENNNRFTTYCRRVINKGGYDDPSKVTFIYHIIEELEKIADEYKYMIGSFNEDGMDICKVTKKALGVMHKTNKFISDYYDLFYSYSKEKAIIFSKNQKIIIREAFALLPSARPEDIIVLHQSIVVTRDTFDLLAPTLAISLKNK